MPLNLRRFITSTIASIWITASSTIRMMLDAALSMRIATKTIDPSTRPTTNSMKNVGSLKNGCSTLG